MNIVNLLIVLLFLIGAGVGGFLMYKQKKNKEPLCFKGNKKIPCLRNLAVENVWQDTTCY